jgi:hypothetical protein
MQQIAGHDLGVELQRPAVFGDSPDDVFWRTVWQGTRQNYKPLMPLNSFRVRL